MPFLANQSSSHTLGERSLTLGITSTRAYDLDWGQLTGHGGTHYIERGPCLADACGKAPSAHARRQWHTGIAENESKALVRIRRAFSGNNESEIKAQWLHPTVSQSYTSPQSLPACPIGHRRRDRDGGLATHAMDRFQADKLQHPIKTQNRVLRHLTRLSAKMQFQS